MANKYTLKCACGRTIVITTDESGKIIHQIKGTGDAILDALHGEEKEEKEGE